MWAVQVELERGMMRSGADKVAAAVHKAKQRGQATRSHVVRGVLTDWLPEVADVVRSWVREVEASKGGPKPVSYKFVKELDPYVAALVALRTILDGVGKENRKLVNTCIEIGRTCEHEQQVRLWAKSSFGDLYRSYEKDHEKNHATDVHRRRVNVAKFNDLVEEGLLVWQPWTRDEHFRVGWTLVECLIRKTGWFEVAQDPDHVWVKGANNSPQLIIQAKPQFIEWLGKAHEHEELHSPDYRPTVMPPKRWDGTRDGGYWTPFVKPPRLVRFKAHQEHQREYAADEYDSLDFPEVYDAIHMLQETAWQINRRVYEVAVKVVALDHGWAKLPRQGMDDLPPRTPRMEAHREAWRQARAFGNKARPKPDEETDKEILNWKIQASPIHRANAKRFSRYKSVSAIMATALEFKEFDRFYFPHMLDFRGRIYPIAAYLQPQGNDLARGLLTFADGIQITEENGGAGWLAIQLATAWGNDKVSYDKRIAWVEERETMWRLIAEDPMYSREWMTCDKPWQALAAIFEWVDFLNTGWGFESRLPVMVDGTCNGIQHLAAISRDAITGRYVNLVPAETPQDIYKVVAVGNEEWLSEEQTAGAVEGLQRVFERIEARGGEQGAHASYWLDLCHRDLPRTLTKRPVMVLPYGGKLDAFFKYVREWLDEADPVPALSEETREAYHTLRNKRLTFCVMHMMDVVKEVVKGGLEVMDWLQRCAKAVSDIDQPIYWQTPSGFVVRHFYGLNRARRARMLLDGESFDVTINERTAKLSSKEQLQGIAPNFIHSLDAAALVLCLKRCRAAGIEDVVSIHDAYGTHAANMGALAHFLREAFVEVHEHDVLGEFRAACQRIIVADLVDREGIDPLEAAERADEALPEPLPQGSLVLGDVLNSPYFFA